MRVDNSYDSRGLLMKLEGVRRLESTCASKKIDVEDKFNLMT